jgi:2,4-dienoyl-CoA reductase-like NADH-dependent reductase (Old Yellow Enzyme family)
MEHQKFTYRHLDELREEIFRIGVELPVSERLDILKTPIPLYGKQLPNRLVIHPMEGCDSTAEGAPGELTFRRYERFGAGGAGLLWVEACAVSDEGRGNARHLFLNPDNLPSFKRLFDSMMTSVKAASGEDFRPYTVLQLTHAGRYSKPHPDATAIVAVAANPYLDPVSNPKRRIISDEELEQIEDLYVAVAMMAKETGFDAVDIKGCHRYLNSELLSAHTREGRYGGSFENRTRFLLNIIDKIRANVDIDITTRINAYDAIPYPYGWGTDENGRPSLDDPKRLMKILWEKGVQMVNISTGNPYFNPHIGRPADTGPYTAPEHPIESAARMLHIIKEMKAAAPDMRLVGTGFSWFREYGAHIAAGCIEQGWMDLAGFGRQSFAYPDFARDIIANGAMVRSKCCIACTKCTELMRFGGQAGCVIKDSKVYLPLWREATDGRTMMSTKQYQLKIEK